MDKDLPANVSWPSRDKLTGKIASATDLATAVKSNSALLDSELDKIACASCARLSTSDR